MKSIEERAKEFSQDYEIIPKGIDCGNCDTCGKCEDYIRYVDIVTEQKAIDIEKACEWLESYIACGVSPEGTYSFVARFRKAMEE